MNGLLLRPARLIVNNQEIPLREESGAQHLHRMVRVPTEGYKLRSDLRFEALSKLGVSPSQLVVDLVASPKNTQESLFCTKANSAWKYNWKSLLKSDVEVLWANPPFSKLSRVVTKVALDKWFCPLQIGVLQNPTDIGEVFSTDEQ